MFIKDLLVSALSEPAFLSLGTPALLAFTYAVMKKSCINTT
jgi:hypothetical protein